MKKELIIDALDNISYESHVEILNKLFGKNYKGHQKATSDINNTTYIWFPKIVKDKNGNIKDNVSGWKNAYNEDCSIITSEPPMPVNIDDEDNVILIFVMFNNHDYRFVGAFKKDKLESNPYKHVNVRIATKVKLIGSPVNKIELIDENSKNYKRVLFANVAYMEKYQGPEEVYSGGSWVKEHRYGYEENNFLVQDGYCYGFVQSSNLKINLSRIDSTCKGNILKDVIIIFTAKGSKGRTIVGYYKNATVYGSMQPSIIQSERYKDGGYYFKCKKEDAYLLSPDDRTFSFPKRKNDNIGQANVWYADTEEAKDIVNDALRFINDSISIGDSGEIIDPNITTIYEEGTKTQKVVNVYERNPKLRRICIQKYGYVCQVCGVNLEDIYGKIGKEFIHVHHIKPISEYGENHEADAIQDLITVCPNCHAMLHRTINNVSPTVEELKEMYKENKK